MAKRPAYPNHVGMIGGTIRMGHGPWGIITVFDPPGSLFTLIPGGGAMNRAGMVTGSFTTPDFSGGHGFVVRLKKRDDESGD